MVFERRLSYGVREETIVMVFERTLTTQLQGECSILLDETKPTEEDRRLISISVAITLLRQTRLPNSGFLSLSIRIELVDRPLSDEAD